MWLRRLTHSYLFIALVALVFGIGAPQYALYLAPYITIFLGIIFFFSALEINLKDIFKQLEDRKMLVGVVIFMLILLPAVTYITTKALAPDLAVAFLLLAAMPVGMTSPLLVEIAGGKQSLALVLTVLTSLLAPFTIPLVVKVLAGAEVSVSALAMGKSLALVIFVPFLIAQPVKQFAQSAIRKTERFFKPVSTTLLGLLIAGVAAKQADAIVGGFHDGGAVVVILVALFVFFIILHILGYVVIFWRNARDRMTITICLTYMNFTLAIYLADTFFNTQSVVLPAVLSVIPWALLLTPFKYVAQKIKYRA